MTTPYVRLRPSALILRGGQALGSDFVPDARYD